MTTPLPLILIVDDIEVNLILLETAMRKEKAKILSATSGEDALKLTEKHEFALILLDVSMPVMNGFELAEYIRKQPLNSITPIIFISAILFDEFSVSQGYRSGAVDYLTKPYHHEVLLSKVRVFLQLYNQKQEILLHSEALEESNRQLELMKEQLEMKLKTEKALSLSSARFSGNVDLSSAIQYMLMDISDLTGAGGAALKLINEEEEKLINPAAVGNITLAKNTTLNEIIKAFAHYDDCDVLFSYSEIEGTWFKAGEFVPSEAGTNKSITAAVRVASGEKLYGYLILNNCCTDHAQWAHYTGPLATFGIITGNAIDRKLMYHRLKNSN